MGLINSVQTALLLLNLLLFYFLQSKLKTGRNMSKPYKHESQMEKAVGIKKKKITNPITLNIFRLIYTTIKYSYNKKEES